MKHKTAGFSKQYRKALRIHLEKGGHADMQLAIRLGTRASAAGFTPSALSKLHEQILTAKISEDSEKKPSASLIRESGRFLASAVSAAAGPETPLRTTRRLEKVILGLSGRVVALAVDNQMIADEEAKHQTAESDLRARLAEHEKLLVESERMKNEMRELSRRIISAQEDERKKISRDLHDIIAQTLIGINVRLAALKKEAEINTKGLGRNILLTQRMVAKSADVVHQFARELRPAVLDDLGLVPALRTFMKIFGERTGIRVHLTVYSGIGNLDSGLSTVLFRVAQEALVNVGRHAGASCVELHINRVGDAIVMKVHDDGKSFNVRAALADGENKRLGLLGMRERVEMVDGLFEVESSPGKGTTVIARIPVSNAGDKAKDVGTTAAIKRRIK